METAVGIVVVVVGVVSTVVVLALFVWAAKKDGEDERAFRARRSSERPDE